MYDPLLIILVTIVIVQNAVLMSRKRILNRGERMILVDTSVLIDGRILEIADARFIPGTLLIPRSVLGELQLLADGSDHEKRLRARNGLELISKLQAVPRLKVDIYHDAAHAPEGVDDRLLSLASKNGFEICTVDYNLQKVAQAQGIKTLSINELSRNLKPLYLPGERIDLPLSQKGQEKNQAIGYASDGTMVVVDGADGRIGQTVPVEIIRSLQTNSGKMMFARLAAAKSDAPKTRGEGRGLARFTKTEGRGARQERGQSRRTRPTDPAVVAAEDASVIPKDDSRPSSRRERPAGEPAQALQRDAPPDRRTDAPKEQAAREPRSRRPRRPSSPEDDLLNLVNKQ